MTSIHPTAVVSEKAKLASNVEIGPYCCVGENVELEEGVKIFSHVVLDGITKIGAGTEVYPFASLGMSPQDLKYQGETSSLIIGKNNKIREYVTMQPGTASGHMKTTIGDNGLFMAGIHVAHDCQIGNHVVMSNNATLGGHVTIGDHVVIGGLSAIHQFARVGHHAFIGAMAGINDDVIPYGMIMGRPAKLAGLNFVGMKRSGIEKTEIAKILKAYSQLFDPETGTFSERIDSVANQYMDQDQVIDIIEFINTDSDRNLCLPGKN